MSKPGTLTLPGKAPTEDLRRAVVLAMIPVAARAEIARPELLLAKAEVLCQYIATGQCPQSDTA